MTDGVTCPRCGSVYPLPSSAARIEGRSFSCARDGALLLTRPTVFALPSDLAALHHSTRRVRARSARPAQLPIGVLVAATTAQALPAAEASFAFAPEVVPRPRAISGITLGLALLLGGLAASDVVGAFGLVSH